jgi:microcystin-dependent protein
MTDTINPASLIPAGTIVPYLGGLQASPPEGWLFCNGGYIDRSTYGDLFAAIGTSYGSTTASNFRLPVQNIVFRGSASFGSGLSATSHSHSFNFSTSGNLTSDSGHNHSMNAPATSNATSDAHNHNQSNYYYSGSNTDNFLAVLGNANFLAGDSHTHGVYHSYDMRGGNHQHAGSVGSSGSGSAHTHSYSISLTSQTSGPSSFLPPHIKLAYIIKT